MSLSQHLYQFHSAMLGCLIGCLLGLPSALSSEGSYTSIFPVFAGSIAVFSATFFISKYWIKQTFLSFALGFLFLLGGVSTLYLKLSIVGLPLLGATIGVIIGGAIWHKNWDVFTILGLVFGFILLRIGLHHYAAMVIIALTSMKLLWQNKHAEKTENLASSFQDWYSSFLISWPVSMHFTLLITILIWSMASIGVDEPLCFIYAGPIILLLILASQKLFSKKLELSGTMPFWISVILCLSIGYFYFINGILFILFFSAFWWILFNHYQMKFSDNFFDDVILILGLYASFLSIRSYDLIITIEALDMPAGLVPVSVRQFVIKDVAFMAALIIIYEGLKYIRHYLSIDKT
ncbi:MAG: hypothetical protein R2774_07720 [Saprospiraceae bacterium]